MSAIGPQFPVTPEQRAVEADQLLQAGHQPPWPLKEKPTSIKGAALATKIAALMAKLAGANAVMANLEEQRATAENDIKQAEEALERLGINSLSALSSIDGRTDYFICAEPKCETVSTWRWDSGPGWRCSEHQLPKPASVPIPEASKGGAA